MLYPAPITLVGAAITAKKNVSFTQAVASFTDSNPLVQVGNFLATIDWGDHSTPSPGTIGMNGSGGFQVFGTHTYTTASRPPYITAITVNNLVGSPGTQVGIPAVATGTASVPLSPVSRADQSVDRRLGQYARASRDDAGIIHV